MSAGTREREEARRKGEKRDKNEKKRENDTHGVGESWRTTRTIGKRIGGRDEKEREKAIAG